MAIQSDQEFAPTQIARAVFPTAFRGYDQDAVRRYLSRLASALEHQQEYAGLGELEARTPAHERVEELENEAEDLRQEIRDLELELVQKSVIGDDDNKAASGEPSPEAVPFDEHRAIELLGKETARVLESARSAAADILKRAETQAASLKAQAKSELAEARRRAETLVAEKQAETEELSTRLTGEAQAEADRIAGEAEEHRSAVLEESAKILTEAEALAESEQQDAEQRAKQVVADAETLRQQVVSELVAERREAQVEMDRMTAARDRLAMSLAVARSELDEVADALVGATSTRSLKSTAEDFPSEPGDDRSHREEVAGLIDQLETQNAEGSDGSGEPFFLDEVSNDMSDEVPGEASEELVPDQKGSDKKPDGRSHKKSDRESDKELDRELDRESDAAPVGKRSKRSKKRRAPKRTAGTEGGENAGESEENRKTVLENSDLEEGGAEAPVSESHLPGNGASSDDQVLEEAAESLPVEKVDEPDDEDVEVIEIASVVTLEGDVQKPGPGEPAEAPNRLPIEQELSLVDGFTTIDVDDVDLRDTSPEDDADVDPASSPPADVGGGSEVDALSHNADPELVHSVMVNERHTPEEVITTVASRTASTGVSRTQGDLLIDGPFTGRLPREFAAREVALTRSGPNFRRQLRRALNDDQSDVLDRLRAGRGVIKPDELPEFSAQIDRYLAPLRRGLAEIAQAGAKAGGQADLSHAALDNLVRQLAKYIVDRVRVPTIEIVEADTDRDRERILEPIRALYRDFRNVGLAELSEDALYEAFAIGLYDSIEPSAPVSWRVDPRSDPDPICDINRQRSDVAKGGTFPSGHARPLALPGCRCLVTVSDY